MADPKNMKEQRDRFLAFAFASSDLFLEVNPEGHISYALGAARGMTGIDEKSLMGRRWLDLFAPADRPVIKSMMKKAQPAARCGPVLARLDEDICDGKKAIVTGIKMPDKQNFYLALGLNSLILGKIGDAIRKEHEHELLDKREFIDAAQEAMELARSMGQDVDMTFFEFGKWEDEKKAMGNENWGQFVDTMSEFLRSKSLDGKAAGEIAEGRYSLVHDKDFDADMLIEQLSAFSQEKSPDGKGLEIASKTVTADLEHLSEREAARALVYTLNEFERKGTELSIDNLNTGLKTYLSANAQKIKDFQSIIERLNFSLHFQPVVNLKTLEASHYEMLTRFEKGDTIEWVMFGEDVGLAPEFDLAVCERAINYVSFKAGGTRTKFAINLSGQSIENDDFFDKLTGMLAKHQNINNRILFEITESTHIRDLNKVNGFITELQSDGFSVCLDDFGAGSSSFQYLQSLNVGYVKIDGKYVRRLLTSQRDVAMVRNLTQMCKDLGIKVIAEFIEEKEQLELLRHLGVHYGQGYYFGRPEPKPHFDPEHIR